MKKEELEILLKRYYDGISTPEDEKALRDYFSSPNVPEGYEAEKAILSYFGNISEIPEPASDFEERIIAGVETSDLRKRKSRSIVYLSSGIAAAAVILICLVFFMKSGTQTEDTYKDPQIAYAETMKILYGISAQLNNGAAALTPVSKMNEVDLNGLRIINESMTTMQKGLGNLKYLDKAIELTKNTESR